MSGPRSKAEADEAAIAAAKGAGWGILKAIADYLDTVHHPPRSPSSTCSSSFASIPGAHTPIQGLLLLSGATLGGWLEADYSLREYEKGQRLRKVRARDDAVWNKWESMVEEEEMAKVRARREGVEKGT